MVSKLETRPQLDLQLDCLAPSPSRGRAHMHCCAWPLHACHTSELRHQNNTSSTELSLAPHMPLKGRKALLVDSRSHSQRDSRYESSTQLMHLKLEKATCEEPRSSLQELTGRPAQNPTQNLLLCLKETAS